MGKRLVIDGWWLAVALFAFAAFAEDVPSWEELAEKAVREAAEKAAREKSETEAAAKATALEAAKSAAEDVVKAAAEKAAAAAATAAAEAAAKEAAEKAVKELTDEKAAKEEAKEERRQIDTRIFKLEHASADEVAEKFNVMWSGEFGVTWKLTKIAVAFPESNSIMITAPRVILDACEKAIGALDVEARQVYIEARFVELGNTASHKIGIDWSGIAGGTTVSGTLGGGFQTTRLGEGVSSYTKTISDRAGSKSTEEKYGLTGVNDSDGMVSYFNGTLSVSQMALTLSALDSTEDAKTFSNPKIIVSSGKKATVDMTTKYPNVKISTKRTTGTSDSVDIASNLEAIPGEDKFMFAKEAFFSWGISLEVTPRIGTNGLINVSIVPTISSLDVNAGNGGWVETGTTSDTGIESGTVSTKYPIIKVQRLISEFSLQSGTTAVIGGLSVTEEKQVDNGIPWLREIPWLGPRLFGSKSREKSQNEIIVFVTVGLVDPREVKPDAGLPKNAVLGRQYTKGQKLEPGDRPEKNMEGYDSLDLRSLEEQALDPLRQQKSNDFNFKSLIPFNQKDPGYKHEEK